jgi:hypothetical protein
MTPVEAEQAADILPISVTLCLHCAKSIFAADDDDDALQGAAEYLQAIADADAGIGTDWTDSKNPDDPP